MNQKSEVRGQRSEVGRICLLFSVFCFLLQAGCAKAPSEDARISVKGYFKDRVSAAPGFSEGVGPTKKEVKAKKIHDLGRRETKQYDFGDKTSSTLTEKAWEALSKKDEKGVIAYTSKCIELYEKDAKKQAQNLINFPAVANIDNYKTMNDVGTCYFIIGELCKFDKDTQHKAKEAYHTLVNNFPYTQYWDPRGWYWNPAEIAAGEIMKIDEGYYD